MPAPLLSKPLLESPASWCTGSFFIRHECDFVSRLMDWLRWPWAREGGGGSSRKLSEPPPTPVPPALLQLLGTQPAPRWVPSSWREGWVVSLSAHHQSRKPIHTLAWMEFSSLPQIPQVRHT